MKSRPTIVPANCLKEKSGNTSPRRYIAFSLFQHLYTGKTFMIINILLLRILLAYHVAACGCTDGKYDGSLKELFREIVLVLRWPQWKFRNWA
jgi:hypothetical protein